jgi:Mlc titration factor MtfA (ptsG expression regulator)
MSGLFKRKRRAKLRRRPLPPESLIIVQRNFPQYNSLTADEQQELQGHIQVFLAEKRFEGCGGLTMTDEIRLTIAAQACLLLLHRETDYFPRMKSILVYPSEFFRETYHAAGGGFVIEAETGRLGESWYRGPVVLSWDSVRCGASDARDGQNVVLHEFAHQLDSEDGAVNGAPALSHRSMYVAWARVLSGEYKDLIARLQQTGHADIHGYAATNPAEFFAVVTECFFEKPDQLRRRHPELYEQFKAFYRQDPAERGEG